MLSKAIESSWIQLGLCLELRGPAMQSQSSGLANLLRDVLSCMVSRCRAWCSLGTRATLVDQRVRRYFHCAFLFHAWWFHRIECLDEHGCCLQRDHRHRRDYSALSGKFAALWQSFEGLFSPLGHARRLVRVLELSHPGWEMSNARSAEAKPLKKWLLIVDQEAHRGLYCESQLYAWPVRRILSDTYHPRCTVSTPQVQIPDQQPILPTMKAFAVPKSHLRLFLASVWSLFLLSNSWELLAAPLLLSLLDRLRRSCAERHPRLSELLDRCQIVQRRLIEVEKKILLRDRDRLHLTAPIPPMSTCYSLQHLNLGGPDLPLLPMLQGEPSSGGPSMDIDPLAQRAIPSRFRQHRWLTLLVFSNSIVEGHLVGHRLSIMGSDLCCECVRCRSLFHFAPQSQLPATWSWLASTSDSRVNYCHVHRYRFARGQRAVRVSRHQHYRLTYSSPSLLHYFVTHCPRRT